MLNIPSSGFFELSARGLHGVHALYILVRDYCARAAPLPRPPKGRPRRALEESEREKRESGAAPPPPPLALSLALRSYETTQRILSLLFLWPQKLLTLPSCAS